MVLNVFFTLIFVKKKNHQKIFFGLIHSDWKFIATY